MIMSVSTLMIGRGAAMPLSFSNFSMDHILSGNRAVIPRPVP
jgi:hypothetical protein